MVGVAGVSTIEYLKRESRPCRKAEKLHAENPCLIQPETEDNSLP
jgi:hypothetical protein